MSSSLILIETFWDPKKTIERFKKETAEVPREKISAAEAIARAEEILRMRGSKAYRKPE